MEFKKLVEQLLQEDVVAGGAGSAFGSGVQATAQQFSKDSYAPGDARLPKSLFGGVITRKGLKKTKKKKRKK
jgi:hypothetical protein